MMWPWAQQWIGVPAMQLFIFGFPSFWFWLKEVYLIRTKKKKKIHPFNDDGMGLVWFDWLVSQQEKVAGIYDWV